MVFLEKINLYLNRMLLCLGGVFLVAMCLLTCANILFRMTWVPIRGTFELMGYFGAVVAAFALGHTRMMRGHIPVNVLVNTFSRRTRNVLNVINGAVCAAFFSLAAWQVAKKATTLMRTGEISETLRMIYYPFTYAVALGCIVLALVLVLDMLKAIVLIKEKKK